MLKHACGPPASRRGTGPQGPRRLSRAAAGGGSDAHNLANSYVHTRTLSCQLAVRGTSPIRYFAGPKAGGVAGLVSLQRSAQIVEAHINWDYTILLNLVFLGLAALLVWRFLKTGGPAMLRMMNQPARAEAHLL